MEHVKKLTRKTRNRYRCSFRHLSQPKIPNIPASAMVNLHFIRTFKQDDYAQSSHFEKRYSICVRSKFQLKVWKISNMVTCHKKENKQLNSWLIIQKYQKLIKYLIYLRFYKHPFTEMKRPILKQLISHLKHKLINHPERVLKVL